MGSRAAAEDPRSVPEPPARLLDVKIVQRMLLGSPSPTAGPAPTCTRRIEDIPRQIIINCILLGGRLLKEKLRQIRDMELRIFIALVEDKTRERHRRALDGEVLVREARIQIDVVFVGILLNDAAALPAR